MEEGGEDVHDRQKLAAARMEAALKRVLRRDATGLWRDAGLQAGAPRRSCHGSHLARLDQWLSAG